MSLSVCCPVCEEKLDDRDVVKGHIVCWKCGWKDKLKIEDEEDCIYDYIEVWLPYD